MRNFGLFALALCAFAANVQADNWRGDYKKITGSWTRLDSDWCGGEAKVSCDGANCEVQFQNTRCPFAELYLEQQNDIFRTTTRSYRTELVRTGAGRYSGNIYIDLRRALTADRGFSWDWKNYWINIALHDGGSNRYEKVCPNFRARDLRF